MGSILGGGGAGGKAAVPLVATVPACGIVGWCWERTGAQFPFGPWRLWRAVTECSSSLTLLFPIPLETPRTQQLHPDKPPSLTYTLKSVTHGPPT